MTSKWIRWFGFLAIIVAVAVLFVWRLNHLTHEHPLTADSVAPSSVLFTRHTGTVFNVALSPDGVHALSGSGRFTPTEPLVDSSLRYWDMTTGEELWAKTDFPDSVYSAAFMPNGTEAVVSLANGSMFLFDLETQTIVRAFEGHTDSIFSVDINDDGTRLVSSSGNPITSAIGLNRSGQDKTVRLWDIATGQQLQMFSAHESAVLDVKFHPVDEALIYSASADGTVRVWNIDSGEEVQRFDAGTWVSNAELSPDGQLLAAATGYPGPSLTGPPASAVILWNAETGEELHRLEGHTAPIISIDFSPDGSLLVSGSHDHTVRVWDVESYTQQALLHRPSPVMFTRFVRDGGQHILYTTQNGQIGVQSLASLLEPS